MLEGRPSVLGEKGVKYPYHIYIYIYFCSNRLLYVDTQLFGLSDPEGNSKKSVAGHIFCSNYLDEFSD